MLFIYKKLRMRRGEIGNIARWVADKYIDFKRKYPTESERAIRIRIAKSRYPNGEFDPSFEANNAELFLTNRVLDSDDFNDVVIAFIRHEIGTNYQDDKDEMRLMYAVIFEEIIEKGIPRGIAMRCQ